MRIALVCVLVVQAVFALSAGAILIVDPTGVVDHPGVQLLVGSLIVMPIVMAAALALRFRRNHRAERVSSRNDAQLMDTVMSSSREWVWAMNGQGIFTFSNQASATMLGWLPADLVGQHCSIVMDPDLESARNAAQSSGIEPGSKWTGAIVRCLAIATRRMSERFEARKWRVHIVPLWASDWTVLGSDRAGFLMFPGIPNDCRGWNAVSHPRAMSCRTCSDKRFPPSVSSASHFRQVWAEPADEHGTMGRQRPLFPDQAARVQYLDNLKVILIAAIIAIHGVLGYAGFDQWWSYADVRETVLQPITEIVLMALVGPFALFMIALLFLVSGLLAAPSLHRKGIKRFVRDRLLRLGVPFLAFTLILWPLLDVRALPPAGGRRTGKSSSATKGISTRVPSGLWVCC